MKDGGIGLDDSKLIPFISPICGRCVHWKPRLLRGCDAFPTKNGIPFEIWKGDADHTVPYPGDHGIRYEEAE
jgi:hypothetical protein